MDTLINFIALLWFSELRFVTHSLGEANEKIIKYSKTKITNNICFTTSGTQDHIDGN